MSVRDTSFNYLFLAVLGLHGWLSLVATSELVLAVASPVAEHRL